MLNVDCQVNVNPSLVAKLLRKNGHHVSLKDVYNRRAMLVKKGLCLQWYKSGWILGGAAEAGPELLAGGEEWGQLGRG